MVTDHSPKLDQQLGADGVAELHPPIQWMLLVVSDQLDQTLKRSSANGIQTTFLLDSTMLHFAFSS